MDVGSLFFHAVALCCITNGRSRLHPLCLKRVISASATKKKSTPACITSYILQMHLLLQVAWCEQHLSDSGANVLNEGRQSLLWTHLLQSVLSSHSKNLLLLLPSSWLHVAQNLLYDLFFPLFALRLTGSERPRPVAAGAMSAAAGARPGTSNAPRAGAPETPPRPAEKEGAPSGLLGRIRTSGL